MYYCSIEDAWGNNFNKKHFNYKSNYKSNSNKTDLIKNKRISLEQQIEKKIEKIYKMKDKKNKLIEKTQLLKLNGGNSQSDTNNYILLGLVLLFIIDVFGNLSY